MYRPAQIYSSDNAKHRQKMLLVNLLTNVKHALSNNQIIRQPFYTLDKKQPQGRLLFFYNGKVGITDHLSQSEPAVYSFKKQQFHLPKSKSVQKHLAPLIKSFNQLITLQNAEN